MKYGETTIEALVEELIRVGAERDQARKTLEEQSAALYRESSEVRRLKNQYEPDPPERFYYVMTCMKCEKPESKCMCLPVCA